MITAKPVTNYPEQFFANTCKASSEYVVSKKESLIDFLSTYNTASPISTNPSGIILPNTAIYSANVSQNKEIQGDFTGIFDLIATANKLFANSRPLTGEYMELLDIAFQKSLSKTPYEI